MARRASLFFVIVVGLLSLGGCDDTFDPRGEGPPFFAVFGVLDGFAGTQLLRIEDIRPPIDSMVTALDAQTTLADPAAGRTEVGRDTALTLADGSLGLGVLFDLPIEAGRVYTLTVTRSTEASAQTTVEIPMDGPPMAVVAEPSLVGTFLIQSVQLATGAREISDMQVAYRLVRTDTGEVETFAIGVPINTLADGISVTAALSANLLTIRAALGIDPGDTERLALQRIGLRFTQARRDVAPIQDGLGEIGWRVPAEVTWTLDAATLAYLGLVDAQGG